MAVVYRAKTGTYEELPESDVEFAARQKAKLQARRSGDETEAQRLQQTTISQEQFKSIQEQQAQAQQTPVTEQPTQTTPQQTGIQFSPQYFSSTYLIQEGVGGTLAKTKTDKGFQTPFQAPFFSIEGQKERVKNIYETGKAIGSRTVTSLYNVAVPKPYEKEQEYQFKVSREIVPSTPLPTKIAIKSAKFIAESPYTTASFVFGGAKATVKGVKIAAVGTGLIGAEGYIGGKIAEYKAQDFTKVKGYKTIIKTAFEKEAPSVSKYNIVYDLSPSFASKKTQQVFTQSVYDQLRARGYSDKEAFELTQQAYSYRRTKGTTSVVQQVTAGATAEGIGRAGYKKFGVSGIQPAGLYEGFGGTIISQKSVEKDLEFKQAAKMGAVGGLTASAFSYAIIKGRKTVGAVGNVLDLSEAPSDVAYSLVEKGTRKTAPKVLVFTPSYTPTLTKTTTQAQIPKGTKEFIGIKAEGISIVPVETTTKNVVYIPTTDFTFTKTSTKPISKVQPQVKPTPIVPVTTPVSVPVLTETVAKTSTKTQAQAQVTPRAATFTSKLAAPPPPFFFKGGGFGFRKGTQRAKTKQIKGYTPSGFAAAFGIKASKRSKAGEFSGLGVRGIVDVPKKKKGRKTFKF